MDIHFECPQCAQPIAIDESGAGLRIDCPGCQAPLIVPEAAKPPAQPEPAAPTLSPALFAPPPHQSTTGAAHQKENASNAGFWMDVPKSFEYPFLGSGPWILAAGTPFLLLFNMLSFAFLLVGVAKLALLGLFGMLFQRIIQASADDDGGTMEWADVGDTSEVIIAALQVLGMFFLVFAPALVCLACALAGVGDEYVPRDVAGWLSVVFAIAGVFCLPMAALALAMFDTLKAVNPITVVEAIVKTFFQYLVVIVLLAVLLCVRRYIGLQVLHLPFTTRLLAAVPAEFITFYTFAVSARLLGVLYRHNADRLQWFK
ncbi:MAG TPA: hypothetical protein VMV72_13295 [Verrucomicrobiae bacterium]|nr:hypothetical protein [Verrucomicrobiae bacterium]